MSEHEIFGGYHMHTFDKSGRISLPAKWRDIIAGREFVVCRSAVHAPHLDFYTTDKYDAIKPRVIDEIVYDALGLHNPSLLELDKRGRMTIMKEFREFAWCFSKEKALLLGTGDGFQLWDEKVYEVIDGMRVETGMNQSAKRCR